MAKTAEEKAAAEAEKEARKEARQEAKEARQEAKAVRQAEKDQIVNLKSAQKAELLAYEEALSDSGLSKKEIKNLLREETQANRQEIRDARQTLAEDGLQWIGETFTRQDGTTGRGPIMSDMDTIGAEYQQEITDDINNAFKYYSDYGLPQLSKRGNTTIGFGVDKILNAEYSRDPETGEYTLNNQFTRTLDRVQDYVKNTFTAEELEEQGVNIKQDRNNPDLYTWKFGSDGKTGYIFFRDNGDGTFTGIGANRTAVDMPSGPLSGLFKSVPYLPEIAAIGASLIPGGQAFVPEILAIGKGLQTASQGGDFGDIARSAGTAYIGSTVVPNVVKSVLPANLASIPGVAQGVTRTTMGVLSGQDLDEALMSGLTAGGGTYIGSEIAGLTGSPEIGKVAGPLATSALAGGNTKEALQGALTNIALQEGIKQIAPGTTDLITDPTARRIAENSLTKIISGGMTGRPTRPDMPTPIPGIVRRYFDNIATGSSKPLEPIRDPYRGPPIQNARAPLVQPLRAAQGGSIRAPLRRNVSELIPLRRGGLSALRGA